MIRVFTSKTQKIGQLGEDLAVKFLKREGFSIICRNYTVKQGEIDVIAKKDSILYFFEVKSSIYKRDVSYETYNPAENMHPKKIERFLKAVNIYLMNNEVSCETDIKLLNVLIDQDEKVAKVEMIDL
ncbi:YraN family protein [Candidatus Parcubacteria bacterium]|nr:YraN family protein [Candidatus Parcubacteria bacterium]